MTELQEQLLAQKAQRISNTPMGLATIKALKGIAKRNDLSLKVYGRGPRKKIFAMTGRHYTPSGGGNSNDIHMNTPQAPYAQHWYVYFINKYPSKPRPQFCPTCGKPR